MQAISSTQVDLFRTADLTAVLRTANAIGICYGVFENIQFGSAECEQKKEQGNNAKNSYWNFWILACDFVSFELFPFINISKCCRKEENGYIYPIGRFANYSVIGIKIMGMSDIPKSVPRNFIHQKFALFRKKKLCTIVKKNIGKKSNLICSQVDSFTPEMSALHFDSPIKSYKKCSNVPHNTVTPKPQICHKLIDFFIIHLKPYCTEIKYIQNWESLYKKADKVSPHWVLGDI